MAAGCCRDDREVSFGHECYSCGVPVASSVCNCQAQSRFSLSNLISLSVRNSCYGSSSASSTLPSPCGHSSWCLSFSFCLCTFFPVLSSWVHLLWSLAAGDIFDYSGQLSHRPFPHSDISFWSQKSRKFIGNEMQHPWPRGESCTLIAKYTHSCVYGRISALAPTLSTITG